MKKSEFQKILKSSTASRDQIFAMIKRVEKIAKKAGSSEVTMQHYEQALAEGGYSAYENAPKAEAVIKIASRTVRVTKK